MKKNFIEEFFRLANTRHFVERVGVQNAVERIKTIGVRDNCDPIGLYVYVLLQPYDAKYYGQQRGASHGCVSVSTLQMFHGCGNYARAWGNFASDSMRSKNPESLYVP